MLASSSISNIFHRLKAPSNSAVFEALVEIRKFIAKHEHNVKKLLEKNVLRELVNILGKPNEKNLDLSLSILGNCCLDYDCRIELFRLGIVKAVATVLNSASRDTIQGRACRVVANLALTYNIAVQLHQENVVNSLLNVLDIEGINSVSSQQMAIRALRILWTVESERISMLELNVVLKVSRLLTIPHEEKEHKELLKAVIKALTVFTYHCSEQCAVQVHADNTVLQHLLTYCSKDEIKASVIICVYNLCHIGSSRPILGTAGVVQVLVNELSCVDLHKEDLNESQTALVSSLCLLCRESVNRAKIRYAGGLPIILSVLRDSPKSSLQSFALHALVQFVYDELSLQELLNEGLIHVLVVKLSNFVKKHGNVHVGDNCTEETGDETISPKKRDFTAFSCENHGENKDVSKTNKCVKRSIFKDGVDKSNLSSDTNASSENWKRFRINSPNYQAVVQEFGYNQRNKERKISCTVGSPSHSSDFLYKTSSPEQYTCNDSYYLGEWSPGSPRSMCFSPESSPSYGKQWNFSPSSPQASCPFDVWSSTSSPVSHGSVDCEIEVYSPVCHEAQSDEDDNYDNTDDTKCDGEVGISNTDDKPDELSTDSPCARYDSPSSNWEKLSVESSSESQHSLTEESLLLVLISRISHMENIIEDLVCSSTLSTLLDYMRLLQHPLPRAGRILGRIVRTHHYFIHLIIQRFVLNIHSDFCTPIHASCNSCDKLCGIGKILIAKLSIVAETGFGEGELSHQLLRGDKPIKETIAVTIPFVIRSHRLLKKLLIECKGLEILQNLLKSYSGEEGILLPYIPSCLSLLAHSLSIENPKLMQDKKYENLPTAELLALYEEILTMSDTNDSIAFLLDNGDTVLADKTFLSKSSPVFEAMLRGNFKESVQKSISLGEISANTFTHLLFIMKLGRVPVYLPNIDLTSSLELLLTLDRFLVPGCEDLTELIMHQFLQPDATCDMYINANEYSGLLKAFDDIRLKTIEFLLVSDMSVRKRREIFSGLMKTACSSQVQSDIFSILHKKLDRYGSRM